MSARSTINSRIVELIEVKNLNPTSFANRLGVSPMGVHHIVGERQSIPKADFLEKLYWEFQDVNMEYIIAGVGKLLKTQQTSTPEEEKESFGAALDQLKNRVDGDIEAIRKRYGLE